MNQALLEVKNLKKSFPAGERSLLGKFKQELKAVDDVSFSIKKGEIFGLVGESGCGKSTTGRCVLRINEPSSGSVTYKGKEITAMSADEMKSMRKQMQMVFQNPYSSLNPRMTIRQTLAEALRFHRLAKGSEINERIVDLLQRVGIPAEAMDRHPHEFSGGQLQRIVIARALSVGPDFIVADEPVSALDVSVQAQILNLMSELRDELGLTYLFIAHDLSVVEHISDRVGVMYLGKLVEVASVEQLYQDTRHPYTKALMSAIPVADPAMKREQIILEGDIPSPLNPPSGCYFSSRCPSCFDRCRVEAPALQEVAPGHYAACHLYS